MRVNEKNYIERLKKRKEEALEFIVDKYLPLVKGVTYKVLSPIKAEGLADECINDVFLSVWNNSSKFTGKDEEFRKWICVIAKCKAIDYYRKEVKKAEVLLESTELLEGNSVENEIIINENREELIALINTLDSPDREIFIMKFFLGKKSDEIALALDITKPSVDNRIYRGKKKLKQKSLELKKVVMKHERYI